MVVLFRFGWYGQAMPTRNDPNTSEYLLPGDASRIAFLTPKTLARLADEGRIAYIRPGKHRRYLKSDVEALVKSGDAA